MTDIETLPADSFLGPKRYKISCRCLRCNRQYSYVTSRLSDDDRQCPRKACKAAALEEEVERRARNMAAIIATQTPPGHIGDKVIVKAIDTTAQVVMEDYKFTDLKDGIRHGESVAPKLPPAQQKLADGFFGGQAMKDRLGGNKKRQREMDIIGKRAMAGAYANMAMNPSFAVPGRRGESPLTLVRTERLRDERR